MPPRPILYWRPQRRRRKCAAITQQDTPCTKREAVRTTAITYNGRPISLCLTHWNRYRAMLPEFDARLISEADPEALP